MLCATVEPPVRLSYDTSSVALKWQMCAISGHMGQFLQDGENACFVSFFFEK